MGIEEETVKVNLEECLGAGLVDGGLRHPSLSSKQAPVAGKEDTLQDPVPRAGQSAA